MVKRWVTVQSCNIGIQATEEAKTTHAQTTRHLPSRGKQKGGSGQSTTHAMLQANRGNEERSQEAAEDREREDTPALEGVCPLSLCPRGDCRPQLEWSQPVQYQRSIRKAENNAKQTIVFVNLNAERHNTKAILGSVALLGADSQSQKLQNCSGHFRMSSFLKDPQCVAVRGEDRSETTAVLPLTQRVDKLQNHHIFCPLTNHVGSLVLLAGAPSCPTGRNTGMHL